MSSRREREREACFSSLTRARRVMSGQNNNNTPNHIVSRTLEPIVALPKNLEPAKATVQPAQKPVSSLKPRPTQPIGRTPVMQNLARVTAPPIKPASQTPKTATPKAMPPKAMPPKAQTAAAKILTVRQEAGSWRLQAGAFRTQANAEALKIKIVAGGLLAQVSRGTDGIYRVLVGTYASAGLARADGQKVLESLP